MIFFKGKHTLCKVTVLILSNCERSSGVLPLVAFGASVCCDVTSFCGSGSDDAVVLWDVVFTRLNDVYKKRTEMQR